MKLYLAGPMSGIPQFNYPAFMEAADKLREEGYDVRNPAELDTPEVRAEAVASTDGMFNPDGALGGQTWGDFLKKDVKIIADEVDGVCLLPGWANSRGARLEAYVALTVQKPVFYYFRVYNGETGEVETGVEEMGEEFIMNTIAKNTTDQGDTTRYGGTK